MRIILLISSMLLIGCSKDKTVEYKLDSSALCKKMIDLYNCRKTAPVCGPQSKSFHDSLRELYTQGELKAQMISMGYGGYLNTVNETHDCNKSMDFKTLPKPSSEHKATEPDKPARAYTGKPARAYVPPGPYTSDNIYDFEPKKPKAESPPDEFDTLFP